MSAPPAAAPPRPAVPASPMRSFLWAAAWLIVAGLGFVVLVLNWQGVLTSDLVGQRTEGVVVFTPIAATLIALLLVIRGIRAVGPNREFRTRWSAEERTRLERESLAGQPSTPFLVFAAILATAWLAGAIAITVFFGALLQRPSGLSLALMLIMLLAMAWISVLQAGLRRRRAAGSAA